MWTYKLIINNFNQNDELNKLIKKLENIEDFGISIVPEKDRQIITFSARDVHKVKESVLTNIAYYIIKEHKFNFFYNQIKKQNLPDIHIKSLSKALTLFDIESDIYLTLNLLPPTGTVVVNSFYMFKMGKLRDKWQEFINVTNLNSPIMLNQEIYIEFLKFLYSAIPCQYEEVNVLIDESNKFSLTDKNNNVLMPEVCLDDELSLVTNLIFLAPKTINLHCINCISNKTFKTLYYIFNKKINFMV